MSCDANCSNTCLATSAGPGTCSNDFTGAGAGSRQEAPPADKDFPMSTTTPPRPSELRLRRIRLSAGPAAAATARRQVEAAIAARDIQVDQGVAVLLLSELVTNAIRHGSSGTITPAVSFGNDQLRVDVHDVGCHAGDRGSPGRRGARSGSAAGRCIVGRVGLLFHSHGESRCSTPARSAARARVLREAQRTLASAGSAPRPADAPPRGAGELPPLRTSPAPRGFPAHLPRSC
jgi:hypothetical protein